MDLANAAAKFWQDGYLVVENAFESSLMDRLHKLIAEHYAQPVAALHTDDFARSSKCEVQPWFPQRETDPSDFDLVDDHPLLSQLTAAILSKDWNNLYSMVMYSRQGTAGQAWHQDCPPESPEQFNLNRLVYTRDIVSEIGGQLMLVPGTHRGRLLPAGEPDVAFPGQITLSPRKGTLVLLHGHTWHRVLPVTGGDRVSTNYRAAPANVAAEITDICVYRNMRYQFSTSSVIEHR